MPMKNPPHPGELIRTEIIGARAASMCSDMNHLLRMQLAYDVAEARQHSRDISVKRYVPA